MKLIVEQIQANGDGYQKPVPGILDPIEQNFQLTINPCLIAEVTRSPADLVKLEYRIGGPDLNFG